jgi:hypothetical protein
MRDGPGLGVQVFLDLMVVEGCWHVGEGAGGGQRVLTLSTGRAGARQRIVHMSTAWALLRLSAPRRLRRLGKA